jgi:hypothetical protein
MTELNVTKLLPDLTIEIEEAQISSVFPDPQGSLQLIVKNQGNAEVKDKDVAITLFASTDSILNPTTDQPPPNPFFGKPSYDERLGTFTETLNLRPGESQILNIDLPSYGVRTPSVVAPGAYYPSSVTLRKHLPFLNEESFCIRSDRQFFF